MLGQLCGDALGSLVEFMDRQQIAELYPEGVREITGGGPFDTMAGQPTDDSEMALMLTMSLIGKKGFDLDDILEAYRFWLDSGPFDCGGTCWSGITGERNFQSQANGALMRASPLGIFGAGREVAEITEFARQDAALTHPNPVCQQANAIFVRAISTAIAEGSGRLELYREIAEWADEEDVDPVLREAVQAVDQEPWIDKAGRKMGWVLVALQNALWQLVHAPGFEDALVDTANRGGDTDTNCAICGALLGSVFGIEAIPDRWVQAVLACKPKAGRAGVRQPRPRPFWPVDALEQADLLLAG